MCGPLPAIRFSCFGAKKKKNRLIAGYVAPGRLPLWLEDRNDILMPSSPPPLPSQPLLALKDTVGVLTGGGLPSIFIFYSAAHFNRKTL